MEKKKKKKKNIATPPGNAPPTKLALAGGPQRDTKLSRLSHLTKYAEYIAGKPPIWNFLWPLAPTVFSSFLEESPREVFNELWDGFMNSGKKLIETNNIGEQRKESKHIK